MTESITARIQSTARVLYPAHSHHDRDKETAHVLRLIIKRVHSGDYTKITLDELARDLGLAVDSPEFAAIMLPLLLEGAITYNTNSLAATTFVSLKGI